MRCEEGWSWVRDSCQRNDTNNDGGDVEGRGDGEEIFRSMSGYEKLIKQSVTISLCSKIMECNDNVSF